MGRKTRTTCRNCGKKITPGKRSMHLVENHKLMPPDKWLEKNKLPRNHEIIVDAMKKNRDLRPPYRWIYQYFDFPDA